MHHIFDSSTLWEHLSLYGGGLLTLGAVSHAVNTFPPPSNKYGIWILGMVKYLVGQREAARSVFQSGQYQTATPKT